jgi:hypothetical protein
MKNYYYSVLKSNSEDWGNLYQGADKKQAYEIAKKASFKADVVVECYEMEFYEYEKGIGEMLPKEDRLYLETVYKGKINRN